MGRLLEQSLRMGMPPAAFAEMFTTALSREVCTGEAPGPTVARGDQAPARNEQAISGPDTAVAL
jgi:hypothetical protein